MQFQFMGQTLLYHSRDVVLVHLYTFGDEDKASVTFSTEEDNTHFHSSRKSAQQQTEQKWFSKWITTVNCVQRRVDLGLQVDFLIKCIHHSGIFFPLALSEILNLRLEKN